MSNREVMQSALEALPPAAQLAFRAHLLADLSAAGVDPVVWAECVERAAAYAAGATS